MSFAPREESRHRGSPVELYLFRYGAGPLSYFAYTNAEQAIAFDDGTGEGPGEGEGEGEGGVVYEPLPIRRGALTSSGTLDKAGLELRVPRTAGVAELFRVWPPTFVVSLVIRAGHHGDPDQEFLAVWSGRLLSAVFEDSHAVLKAEPLTTSMRRQGLRRHYQFGCPHVLYGPQCNADKPAATVATTVESVSGRSVTLPAGWPGEAAAAEFLAGMLEWDTPEGNHEVRTILKVTDGRTLLLSGLVPGLEASDAVAVVRGCAHTMEFCAAVHDNIHNFGGQPWIPVRSPFGFRNEFY